MMCPKFSVGKTTEIIFYSGTITPTRFYKENKNAKKELQRLYQNIRLIPATN